MRKFLIGTFDVLSIILFALGIIFLFMSVAENPDFLVEGLLMIPSCLFTKGFGYIVEAACLYVEKNGKSDREQENEKEKEAGSTAEGRLSIIPTVYP